MTNDYTKRETGPVSGLLPQQVRYGVGGFPIAIIDASFVQCFRRDVDSAIIPDGSAEVNISRPEDIYIGQRREGGQFQQRLEVEYFCLARVAPYPKHMIVQWPDPGYVDCGSRFSGIGYCVSDIHFNISLP